MEKKIYTKNLWEVDNNCQLINPNDYNFQFKGKELWISLVDKIVYESPNKIVEINETSISNPIILEHDTIKINPTYYKNNQEQIDKFILELINNFKGDKLSLDKNIINDDLFKLIKNKDLNEIRLGYKREPYVLKEKDLNYIQHIKNITVEEVEDKLKDSIPTYLNYKPLNYLVGRYDWHDLNNYEVLYFYDPLSEEEISNLKYIGKQVKKISIEYNDFRNILKVISNLSNVEVVIKVEDKFDFPFEYFEQFDNVFVENNREKYPVKYVIEQEAKLEKLVKNIKNSNLSPLEKYLAVYDIVKKFKQYKENEENLNQSRKLYELLDNKYIVCLGFAKLLEDLLRRIGIKAVNSVVEVILNGNELENYNAGHARVLVYLNDPKYNIKGYFVADPTWDNKMNENYYNYSLMTPHDRELDRVITYSKDDLYGSDSFEELQKRFQKSEFVLTHFMDNLKYFDKEFYENLLKKHGLEEKKFYLKLTEQQKNDLINDLSIFTYIKENTEKEISGVTLIDAAMEVYKFQNPDYTLEEYQQVKNDLIKSNIKRQEEVFPKIERYNDTEYDVIGNKNNKFSR